MKPLDQCIEVWGPLACFSRPELKIERFSYPAITPSAARGIYEAIYAKPKEFRWQVTGVEVLAPVNYLALRRNEVKEKVSVNAVQRWMAGKEEPEPLWADGDRELSGSDAKGRTQRQTMALKNPRYRLHAVIRPWPGHEGKQQALEAQFRRRAAAGKCFCQPCFGCREFPAYFDLVEPDAPDSPKLRREMDMEIGLMLYDVFDLSRPGSPESPPFVSLFRAVVREGIMPVPAFESAEVLKPAAGTGGGHA
jgi:CRISPR-associated protein Cas5d